MKEKGDTLMTRMFERFETAVDYSAMVLLLASFPAAAAVMIAAAF